MLCVQVIAEIKPIPVETAKHQKDKTVLFMPEVLYVLMQKESVVAAEWQLSCNSPSREGSCSAKALLRGLLVNPAGLTTDLPLLQPVPLTLTLQVEEVRIQLLAETADAPLDRAQVPTQTRPQALGVVYATSCQVRSSQ